VVHQYFVLHYETVSAVIVQHHAIYLINIKNNMCQKADD